MLALLSWCLAAFARPVANEIVDLALGEAHSCALVSNGTVACWGRNNEGQLGRGDLIDGRIPETVVRLRDVVQVVSGLRHVCARTTAGAVWCWGANDAGQMGQGRVGHPRYPTPVQVPVPPARWLAAGADLSCATTEGGHHCWGGNALDSLAGHRGSVAASPVVLEAEALAVAISVGAMCGVRADGAVSCWGMGSAAGRDLASGADRERLPTAQEIVAELSALTSGAHASPRAIEGLAGAVEVAAGGSHVCARLGDATVRCWGSNRAGQLGVAAGSATETQLATLPVRGVTGLALGDAFTCALRDEGTVQCFGAAQVAGEWSGFRKLAAGTHHVCGVMDKQLRCWGDDAYGQLGSPIVRPADALPYPVAGLSEIQQVAVGRRHSCAVSKSGAVACWGKAQGQELVQWAPVVDPNAENIRQVSFALGGGAPFGWSAVSTTGTVQLHHLSEGRTTAPPPNTDDAGVLAGVPAMAQVKVGVDHACALTTDGQLFCMGNNRQGQLGIEGVEKVAAPAPVMSEVQAFALGDRVTLAVDPAGIVYGWGSSAGGVLGDRDDDVPVPTPLDLVRLSAVALGDGGACGVALDGGVLCWGNAWLSQTAHFARIRADLGPPPPTPVLDDVAAISVGGDQDPVGCAATKSGKLFCWGRSTFGLLGPGQGPEDALEPVVIPLAGRVTEVAVGRQHACALTAEGNVWCWGAAADGRLGDGIPRQRSTSVAFSKRLTKRQPPSVPTEMETLRERLAAKFAAGERDSSDAVRALVEEITGMPADSAFQRVAVEQELDRWAADHAPEVKQQLVVAAQAREAQATEMLRIVEVQTTLLTAQAALSVHLLAGNELPTAEAFPALVGELADPWGRPVVYQPFPGGYLLRSAGVDSRVGTGDDVVDEFWLDKRPETTQRRISDLVYDVLPGSADWGALEPVLDSWGRAIGLERVGDGLVRLHSLGPDGLPETADDLRVERTVIQISPAHP